MQHFFRITNNWCYRNPNFYSKRFKVIFFFIKPYNVIKTIAALCKTSDSC